MKEKLSIRNLFGHISANLAYSFSNFIVTFIMYYATESIAIAVATVSAMIVIVKVLDAFTDIIAGIMIDKTKSRFGKARPWFLWVSVPYAVCLALTFSISPNLSDTAKIVLLGVMYALTVSVFGTVVGVAKVALIACIAKDQGNRSVIGVIGDTFGGVFAGLGMVVTLPLVGKIGWSKTYIIYAVIAFAACIFCFLITREYDDEVKDVLEEKKMTVKDLFGSLFHNKYSLVLLLLVLLIYISMGVMQTGGTYFFQYVIEDVNMFTVTMAVSMVAGIVGMFVAAPVMKKAGNRNSLIFALSAVIVCYVILLLFGGQNAMVYAITLSIISALITCFVIGAFSSMAAMTADYGEYKTGVRTEGVSSSVVNIGIKVGSAIAAGLLGAIMAAGGFVEGGAGVQTAKAVQSIQFAYIYIPLIMFAVALILVIFGWKLNKEYPTIRAALDSRRENQGEQKEEAAV